MIKRNIALFFILLANIILFANAVIPHHHHQDEVCIINTHCESDNETHKHSEGDHSHSHNGDNNSMHCVLDQVEGICPSTIKIGSKSLHLNIKHHSFATFQVASFNESFIQGNFLVLKHPPDPTIQSSYTCIISQTKGLRAPPYIS